MATKLIAEDGRQRQHRESLRQLLGAARGSVRVASAYVTDTELLLSIKNRQVQLLMSLVPLDIVSGATSTRTSRWACEFLAAKPESLPLGSTISGTRQFKSVWPT